MHAETPSDSGLLWVYPKVDPEWIKKITDEFHIHPVAAQVLASRGFDSLEVIHDFLYAQLPDLHDPYLLNEMTAACDRVMHALANNEGILIYGDNDVDGMTSTVLLTEFLREVGGNTHFFLASRNTPRSHLIVEAVEYAAKRNCKLIITVDCGVTAAAEIEKVAEAGVDVIVTDHHEPTDTIPHCIATLNPKLVNSTYPNRDITGVGVAFKLAHALTSRLTSEGMLDGKEIDLKQYLDLVALGTISDMGALLGENRILVRYGLMQLQAARRVGFAKLCEVAGVNPQHLTTIDVASKIAPRLNSLGRIDDPHKGVDLLLMTDPEQASSLAHELDLNNTERQKIDRTMSMDVDGFLSQNPAVLKEKGIVLDSDGWHPGVIAIIATRISKTYNRPTAIIAVEDGMGKGSIRSISEFPLLPHLKKMSHLLENFGGHDFAAGVTLKQENIPEFRKGFIEAANAELNAYDVVTKLTVDAEVRFTDLTFDLMESLRLLEPHGNENPQPILFADTIQAWPPKVVGRSHLKLYLEQEGRVLEGIGFGMGPRSKGLRRRNLQLRVAVTPQVNVFQGKTSIQLMIRDICVSD